MSAAARQFDVPRSVLIIEDEHQICELLTDILEEAGFEAHCACTDKAAYVALAAGTRYAAVLVDINLGEGVTGFDVARFARRRDPSVPVLYVTGHATEGSFKAFGVPDSAFVPKPFSPDDLLGKLLPLVDAAAR
jgi:DNA-binding response OmpR family regulator